MRNFRFSKTPQKNILTIDKFQGVDFVTHPTKVELSRSPDCLNMIADEAYFPRKRYGYRKICGFEGEKVYGLFYYKNITDEYYVCHVGRYLYTIDVNDGSYNKIYSSMAERPSKAFTMNQKLFILDGENYLEFNGTSCEEMYNRGYEPTTTINRHPGGGGTSFEPVNLIGRYRINTFIGDGVSTAFRLDAQDIYDFVWTSCTTGYHNFTHIDTVNGIVHFDSAPANGNGVANVTIKFIKDDEEQFDKIRKCTFFGMYGGDNDTRVFLSGNPNYPNMDFQSGLFDPTYFPDLGYTKIGSDSSAIMGYARQFDSQIIIKENNGQDATQYLRSFSINDDGNVLYPVVQGAKGSGAISNSSFSVFGDVPYFLSSDGVYGVFGTNISQNRTISNVSYRINPKLLHNKNLHEAVSHVFRNKYYLAIGDECYVADGKLSYSNGQPEWFYWNNIGATCFMDDAKHLYFGTATGDVLVFYDEDDIEEEAYQDNGRAISSYWTTPFTSLGYWHVKKTITDIFPVLMPYLRSSVYINYKTENDIEKNSFSHNVDLFTFLRLNFSRFSFKTIKTANAYRDKERIRKKRLLQIIVGNDKINEPFGILAIIVKYIYGSEIL